MKLCGKMVVTFVLLGFFQCFGQVSSNKNTPFLSKEDGVQESRVNVQVQGGTLVIPNSLCQSQEAQPDILSLSGDKRQSALQECEEEKH